MHTSFLLTHPIRIAGESKPMCVWTATSPRNKQTTQMTSMICSQITCATKLYICHGWMYATNTVFTNIPIVIWFRRQLSNRVSIMHLCHSFTYVHSVTSLALAFPELYVRILMTATCAGSVHLDIMEVHSEGMTYRTQINDHRYINCPEHKSHFLQCTY